MKEDKTFIAESKAKANPETFGVKYGIDMSRADQENNLKFLNECLAQCGEIEITGDIEIYGSAKVRSGHRISGQSRSTCSIRGKHPTAPTIIDNTVGKTPNQSNNSRDVVIRHLKVESEHSHCFHVTPYQWTWDSCRFSCAKSAIKFYDGGYQVENYIINNYFIHCGRGIDSFLEKNASGDYIQRTFKATDQYVLNNVFFRAGEIDSAIKMFIPSGSRFDGNHYYGGAAAEFVYFSGGSNVRVANEYFENMKNARMRINFGAPHSEYNIVGCSFFGGNGSQRDHNGNQSHLVTLSFNPDNYCSATFVGNSFSGASSKIPVFGLLNGRYSNLGGANVQFDKSNLINSPNYSKAVALDTGDNETRNVIQSNHPNFIIMSSDGKTDFTKGDGSEYIFTYSGVAEKEVKLPASPRWSKNKPLIIRNMSGTTTLKLAQGRVFGMKEIPTGCSASIMQKPDEPNSYLCVKLS
ncbi:hypothetical protein [Pseudoalteromonas sp. A757]|uniref:hypothetical protein n=1 Tax=Pseudoalteromonas sp. A757 TaxID=2250709 RepID=UPI000FFEC1F3|nr:hypothetical protein [Pseudoalteromonas sp. A757]RXE85490.1 hypothetical protein DRB05_17260 [Pseudoalteromonas sp. A757]